MRVPAILAIYGGVAIAAVGVLWYVKKKLPDVNKGTPYEGAGAVGTLGNVANQLSGGTLAQLGDFIGGSAYDWFNPSGGIDTYYPVTFPDGSRHAVHSTDIDASGYYYRNEDSTYYRIKISGGTRVAVQV